MLVLGVKLINQLVAARLVAVLVKCGNFFARCPAVIIQQPLALDCVASIEGGATTTTTVRSLSSALKSPQEQWHPCLLVKRI